jgi:ribonuclease HII
MTGPSWHFEEQARAAGYLEIAGVDEAGRGPLAGPVSAAAVVLPEGFGCDLLNDSKKLTERVREDIFSVLTEDCAVSWHHSFGEAGEVDEINILQATSAAMRRAVAGLPSVDYVLIDGRPVKNFPLPSEGIIKGDGRSFSIAAASIIAKVLRDREMVAWDKIYPQYGFANHKGYGTKVHLEALRKYGPCPIHRRSFAPVAAAARLRGEWREQDGSASGGAAR